MDKIDRMLFEFLPKWGAWLGIALIALCILAECGRRVGWAWFS